MQNSAKEMVCRGIERDSSSGWSEKEGEKREDEIPGGVIVLSLSEDLGFRNGSSTGLITNHHRSVCQQGPHFQKRESEAQIVANVSNSTVLSTRLTAYGCRLLLL